MKLEIELMHTKDAGLRYFLFVNGTNGERLAYYDISKTIKNMKCDKALRDFVSAFNDISCRECLFHIINDLIVNEEAPFRHQFSSAVNGRKKTSKQIECVA